MPVASLVLGIIGTLLSWHPFMMLLGVPCAILAIIFGIMSRKRLAAQQQPTGMATAGLVLGIVGATISALIFAACAACVGMVGMAGHEAAKQVDKAQAQQQNQEFNEAFKKALEESQKTPPPSQPAK